jgi:hypothetical protein
MFIRFEKAPAPQHVGRRAHLVLALHLKSNPNGVLPALAGENRHFDADRCPVPVIVSGPPRSPRRGEVPPPIDPRVWKTFAPGAHSTIWTYRKGRGPSRAVPGSQLLAASEPRGNRGEKWQVQLNSVTRMSRGELLVMATLVIRFTPDFVAYRILSTTLGICVRTNPRFASCMSFTNCRSSGTRQPSSSTSFGRLSS